ncbi:MAG: hypothetical protein ACLRVT_05460, partial [Oscillospiraceae bacterium]
MALCRRVLGFTGSSVPGRQKTVTFFRLRGLAVFIYRHPVIPFSVSFAPAAKTNSDILRSLAPPGPKAFLEAFGLAGICFFSPLGFPKKQKILY